MFSRAGLCAEHRTSKSRPRKSTNDRDYGQAHQKARAAWAPLVASGNVECHVCERYIGLGDPWDLDHTDDRTGYLGPAHRHCNRSKAAHKKNRLAAQKAVARRWEGL